MLQLESKDGEGKSPPVESSVVSGGRRWEGGTTLGLDLHSPVRISDFVVWSGNRICGSMAEGETVTPRSPAIWRCQRIDQEELDGCWICHLPEAGRSLWDQLRSKRLPWIAEDSVNAKFYDKTMCNTLIQLALP